MHGRQPPKTSYHRLPFPSLLALRIFMATINSIGPSSFSQPLSGNIRRFSAAPQRHGPRGHQALAGTIRYAVPFNYSAFENTVLQDIPFLRLPDIVQCFGPVRATGHSLHIDDTVQNWLCTGALRLFNHTDLLQSWLIGAQIFPTLAKYFTGELTLLISQISFQALPYPLPLHLLSCVQILPQNAPAPGLRRHTTQAAL